MIAVTGKMFSSIATKTKKGELEKNISFLCTAKISSNSSYLIRFVIDESYLRQNAIFSRENPVLESIIKNLGVTPL